MSDRCSPVSSTPVSSAIALRARAAAMPALLPTRNFTRLLLLGGATLALIGALHQLHTPSLSTSVPENAAARVISEAIQKPAQPSVFVQEQTMPSSALMARWEPVIQDASRRFKIPAEWIRAVMRQESGGRTMLAENLPIVSSTGAMGIMQVMPGTYTEMASQYRLGGDPHNPRDNIFAGTAYLKWLHFKYGYPAMFAAYNDGPGNIEGHLHRGRPLPAETRGYIAHIAKSLGDKTVAADLTKVALTQPDGTKVTVDANKVTAVHPAIPGIYAASVKSVVTIGKLNRGVREDVAEATSLLRGHGAKL
ncbi:MAG: lytic transglycosylase domain-containing protein [Rhizomicrobium sp.]